MVMGSTSAHFAASLGVAVLFLAGCSGGGSGGGGGNASSFCQKLTDMSVQFAGLQNNPTQTLIQQAASAAENLVSIAPSQIETAVKTEADAYQQWAKTGDSSALQTDAFSTADSQISNWTSAYCKQSQ